MADVIAPEDIEIDGRKGVAVYIDDDFKPVSKDLATAVKIVFEDGEIKFGIIAPKGGAA